MPPRGVVEADLGAWKFRRFQGPLLDVEVWVDANRAEAYSASYITADAEKRGRIEDKDLVNVFVTRYATADGVVRATVKLARRLAAENGYQVTEDKIAGARLLSITGRGETWVMWPSSQHVVKLGGRGRTDVPPAMIASYAERYPSQLPGGALEGPLPPGPPGSDAPPRKPATPEYDPNNPRPDAEHYDPEKVKLPGSGSASPAEAPAVEPADAPAPAPARKPAKPKKRRAK